MNKLTTKDLIKAWAASNLLELLRTPYPTSEQLNDGMTHPFVPPTDDAINNIRHQISYDVWLYIKGADHFEIPYIQSTTRFAIEGYTTQLLALLGDEVENLPTTHPAVQARILWLKLKILRLCLRRSQKTYYELTAEAMIERASHDARLKQLEEGDSQELRLSVLRMIWGFLPDAELEERDRQEKETLEKERSGTVAPCRPWSGTIYEPGFRGWWIIELSKRPLDEITAYLTVQWRAAQTPSALRGDRRYSVTPEDVIHLDKMLKWASAQANASERLVLEEARKWFMMLVAESRDSPTKPQNESKELVLSKATTRTQGAKKYHPAALEEVLTARMSKNDLDTILIKIGMIELDPSTGALIEKSTTAPWQWAYVRDALSARLLIAATLSDSKAAALFKEAYKAKVGRGTMSAKPSIPRDGPKSGKDKFYIRFLELLPAINDGADSYGR